MKTHAILTGAAFLLGVTGFAQAEQTIASPPVLIAGGSNQVACYVRNVGASAVSVKVQISDETGARVEPIFQNCNDSPLPPGRNCAVLASPPNAFFAACSATAGIAKRLRGTFEVRNSGSIFSAQDLR